jgi:hypothetical protein
VHEQLTPKNPEQIVVAPTMDGHHNGVMAPKAPLARRLTQAHLGSEAPLAEAFEAPHQPSEAEVSRHHAIRCPSPHV